MSAEPRYTQYGPVAAFAMNHAVTCVDCGAVVTGQAAHTRFHSILSGHAWALAVLETSHVAAHVHEKYDVAERIGSRKFGSWSGEALAEVIAQHDEDGAP